MMKLLYSDYGTAKKLKKIYNRMQPDEAEIKKLDNIDTYSGFILRLPFRLRTRHSGHTLSQIA